MFKFECYHGEFMATLAQVTHIELEYKTRSSLIAAIRTLRCDSYTVSHWRQFPTSGLVIMLADMLRDSAFMAGIK